MRSLGVQFRTSAHGVTLSSLELVSKTTYDRKRVWCPPDPGPPSPLLQHTLLPLWPPQLHPRPHACGQKAQGMLRSRQPPPPVRPGQPEVGGRHAVCRVRPEDSG